ncbi:MAG: STAS domain-containing protein [Planctomycetota bacterium]
MKIGEQRFDDVTVVAIAGDFDARTAPHAHEKLDSLLEQFDSRLVFNLSGLDIVTSTAISFLIDAAKRARKMGGDAVLSQPTRLLQTSLNSLDIGDYFQSFESDADAVAHFRALKSRAEKEAAEEATRHPDEKRPWWRLGR